MLNPQVTTLLCLVPGGVDRDSFQVAGTERDTKKRVLHPHHDLKLQEISCDEEVVERCGMQIFRIEDRKTQELVSDLLSLWAGALAYGLLSETFGLITSSPPPPSGSYPNTRIDTRD